MRMSQKHVFHQSKSICAIKRILSTTAMYVSSSSLMYLRIPCYCDRDACLNSSALRVGVTTLLNTIQSINTKVSIAPSFILNWCVCMSAAASRRNWLSCCWLPGSQSITPHFSTVLLKLINNTHNSNVTGHSKVCGSKEVRSWIWIQWNSPQSDKRAYKRFRNHGCKRTFSKLANCLCFLFCKEQLFEFLIR